MARDAEPGAVAEGGGSAGWTEVHPFRSAWQTRDLNGWIGALAPDVVLHSPVTSTPFRGIEAARELYGVLFESLGEVEITDELTGDSSHAFYWRADAGGKTIEGTDLLRYDEQGKISEVRVMIRPLVGIAAFAASSGPPLASKRGRYRGPLLRLLTLPLKGMLALVDLIAGRLAQPR